VSSSTDTGTSASPPDDVPVERDRATLKEGRQRGHLMDGELDAEGAGDDGEQPQASPSGGTG
jgi:hypothetical protein